MYIFPGARRSFAQQVRPYSIDLLFLLIFNDMLSPADAACPCNATQSVRRQHRHVTDAIFSPVEQNIFNIAFHRYIRYF